MVGLEIYMGVRSENDWLNRIYKRVVMLCGKYGIPFLHTDGNRNDIDLAAVIRRPIFTDVLREYSEYIVFHTSRTMQMLHILVMELFLVHG